MRINSISDLAATLRGRRLALGLSQSALAARAAVSRDWLNSFERGKATVELQHVFRVIDALGLSLSLEAPDGSAVGSGSSIDLDALLDEYRR